MVPNVRLRLNNNLLLVRNSMLLLTLLLHLTNQNLTCTLSLRVQVVTVGAGTTDSGQNHGGEDCQDNEWQKVEPDEVLI